MNPLGKQNSLDPVFILDGLRTPIGHPFMGLRDFSAAQLAAAVLKKIVERGRMDRYWVDEVILGNVVSAGTGQNPARQAAVLAGLPKEIPALTINNVCGAGLQSVVLAARSILAQDADLILAGGTESATRSPYFVKREDAENYEAPQRELNPVDCLVHDGLLCQITGQRMGELVESLASQHGIGREEQDDYAFESHRKAVSAQRQDKFRGEILPVKSPKKPIRKDEHPRRNLDREWLTRLPPVFWTGGTVTAGNSSLPCDGAAAVLAASERFVRKHKVKPLARILGYASIAIAPERGFESITEAVGVCLKKCGLRSGDIDLFELNEAFAAQIIFAGKQLKIPSKKINIFGGDIALGHPLGAAGARILVTLINALRDRRLKKGLACISYGGGGAVAMIVEAV